METSGDADSLKGLLFSESLLYQLDYRHFPASPLNAKPAFLG
jgi:hypothetical protein